VRDDLGVLPLGMLVDGFGPALAEFEIPPALVLRLPGTASGSAVRVGQPLPDIPPGRLVVAAGPRAMHALDEVRRFAAAGNLPVANTWGAKGLFRWDSPHHMGTFGLQHDDAELLGLDRFDAVVTTGLDPAEWTCPRDLVEVPVHPSQMHALEPHLHRADSIPPNDMYTALSAVAQPGFVNDKVPRHPARAIADLKAVLPPGGIVTADPGWVGLWVARCFPTDEPGSVVVPARRAPGIAAALALVARTHGLPAIAITAGPLDDATAAVLELARARRVDLPVVAWTADGVLPDDLAAAVSRPGVTVTEIPVDRDDTRLLIDAAGPVVAWGGLDDETS
jgi:hypothetical protein